MNWIELTDVIQLEQLKEQSKHNSVVIFKYSSRCATSDMAKHRLERVPPPPDTLFYFLDLLRYRALSDKIAEDFQVHHESPQVLVIKNGECIYEDSHNGICMQDIAAQVGNGN